VGRRLAGGRAEEGGDERGVAQEGSMARGATIMLTHTSLGMP
jgi:hypothetical protein